jgi:tetratricopeptide (TPR) repeat protein
MKREEEIQTPSSKENLDKLLEQMPLVSLGRNDPCACGSKKKYKNCCLNQERRCSSSAKARLQSFTIKFDALTPEESLNDFPPVSEEDEEVMAILYHTLIKHPDMLTDNCDFFRQLDAMRSKYPNNPIILNYLASGYQLLDQQERADAVIDETYERFPDYLFAKIGMANKYLRRGVPDKAIQVFRGSYTLKSLYPHRTVFHISEVRAFEYFMVEYFCMKNDVKQAEIHLQCLEKVLEEDDPYLQNAQKRVHKVRG